MYVEQLKTGRWAVCENDSTVLATCASRSAATRHMNDLKLAPYPFCRTPNLCAGKGYCPSDIACNE